MIHSLIPNSPVLTLLNVLSMPFPFLGAIGLSAGGSLLSQVINRSNQAETVRQQKELADYLYREQESPEAQVRSMRSAGLNPNMLNGSPSSGAVTPSVNPVSPASVDFGLSNAVDIGLMEHNKQLLEAQAFNARSGGKLADEQSKFVNAQTFKQQFENDYILPLDKQLKESNIQLNEEQANQYHAAADMYSASVDKISQEIENLKKQGKLTDIECDRASSLIKLIGAQVSETYAQARLANEQAVTEGSKRNLMKEQAKSEMAQQKFVNWNSSKLKAEVDLKQIEAQAQKDLGPKWRMIMTGAGDILDVADRGMNLVNIAHQMTKAGKTRYSESKSDNTNRNSTTVDHSRGDSE